MGGSGLQQRHVGREEELAAAVLAEEDRQEDSGRAALVKGRGHLVEHGVHLKGEDHPTVRRRRMRMKTTVSRNDCWSESEAKMHQQEGPRFSVCSF